jgi:hypothetical protein
MAKSNNNMSNINNEIISAAAAALNGAMALAIINNESRNNGVMK